MSCPHTSKTRISGPFTTSTEGYRIVCKDCLQHLSWGTDSPSRVLADTDRIPPKVLVDMLDNLPTEQRNKLSDWDKKFLGDLSERATKYPTLLVSSKQQEILDKYQIKYIDESKWGNRTAAKNKAPDYHADIPF